VLGTIFAVAKFVFFQLAEFFFVESSFKISKLCNSSLKYPWKVVNLFWVRKVVYCIELKKLVILASLAQVDSLCREWESTFPYPSIDKQLRQKWSGYSYFGQRGLKRKWPSANFQKNLRSSTKLVDALEPQKLKD